MNSTDASFWENRWQEGQTGWDLGGVAPAMADFFRRLPDPGIRVLIPGCGNAHEAAMLVQLGFGDITLLDIAPAACAVLASRFDGIPGVRIECADFFTHTETYDLVVEQTFFCALDPSLRPAYARHMAERLRPGSGMLAGLLFNTEFENAGPPFGGSSSDYRHLFEPHFTFRKWEAAQGSHPARMGREWWMELGRK